MIGGDEFVFVVECVEYECGVWGGLGFLSDVLVSVGFGGVCGGDFGFGGCNGVGVCVEFCGGELGF